MPGVSRTNSTPQPLHPAVQALREFALEDIDAFVQSNIHIINTEGKDQLLQYRYGQRLVAAGIRRQMRKMGRVRRFDLKSRQIGITTQVVNRNGVRSLCADTWASATVAHLEDRAQEMLDKARYAYSRLPQLLQLELSRDSKGEIKYADTNSVQTIVSAKNVEAVRSCTRQDIHLSEWALYKNAEQALFEVSQVCHSVDGTSIHIETTGRNEGSYAHWFWKQCKAGKNEYVASFLAWQDDPECDYKFRTDFEQDMCLREAYEYAPQLAERAKIFKLTPGNVYWAYLVLKNKCHGNWEKFLEDYPCSEDECWRSKGDVYFGAHHITYLQQHIKEIPFYPFVLTSENMEKGFKNPFTDLSGASEDFDPTDYDQKPWIIVYRGPQPGQRYVVSGDSAGGGEGGDPSHSYVINMNTGEMMAEFHGLVQTHQHAHIMESLAVWYNMALCAPECNNMGLATLNELQRTYHNIYVWKPFDTVKAGTGRQLGWYTGVKSRAIMLELALRVVKEVCAGHAANVDFIKSALLVHEMKSFKEDTQTGVPSAAAGCHDDAVLSFAIAWIVATQETKGSTEDILKKLRTPEAVDETIQSNAIVLAQLVDVDKQIARIKQHLGIVEDLYNVKPLSETG